MGQAKSIEAILDQIARGDRVRKSKRELFKGTVKDYLELALDKPEIVETPHQKLHRVVVEKLGREEIRFKDNPKLFRALGLRRDEVIFRYKAFPEFFGLEEPIEFFVSFLHQAAMDSEDARQAVWLVGPVGGGKTSFLDKVRTLLEQESMFVLESVLSNEEFGCHMWDSPLRVLPRHIREELARELKISIPLKDDICPNCKWRLNTEFNNEYLKFPVEEVEYSRRGQVGIGKVTYVEAEEADISELVGSMNLSLIGTLPEGHPRAVLPNGACNKMNGGMGVFSEAPNMPASYLAPFNTITQEGELGLTARQPHVSLRTVLFADANEEPFLRFFEDEENKKLYDRAVTIYFPYNIRLDEEVNIHQKLNDISKFKDVHIAPHTLEFVGTAAVLSRLKPSEICPNPILKMKILNGDDIEEEQKFEDTTRRVTAVELRKEHRWDGMDGISTRVCAKVLGSSFSYKTRRGVNCIDPLIVYRFFRESIERDKVLAKESERHQRYLDFIELAFADWVGKVKHDLTTAFVTVRKEYAESVFQRYLDNADLWLKDQRGEKHPFDEKILSDVEKLIGLKDFGAKNNFRQEMVNYANQCKELNRPLCYSDNEKMKKALDRYVLRGLKEFLQTPHEDRLRTPERKALYNNIVEELKRNGYCDHCAPTVINWYSENIS